MVFVCVFSVVDADLIFSWKPFFWLSLSVPATFLWHSEDFLVTFIYNLSHLY